MFLLAGKFKNKSNEDISFNEEVESLEKEIQHLRAKNCEKKEIIKKVSDENEFVIEQLRQI